MKILLGCSLLAFAFTVRHSVAADSASVCAVCDCRPCPENRNQVLVTCTPSFRQRRQGENGENDNGELMVMDDIVEDGFFAAEPKVLTAPLIEFPCNFPNATGKGKQHCSCVYSIFICLCVFPFDFSVKCDFIGY